MNYIHDIARAREVLDARFGGQILKGEHEPNGKCCVMELRSVLDEVAWTDAPLGTPWEAWARAINDAPWSSDAARTEAMLPVACLGDPSPGWETRLAEITIRRVVPVALRAAGAAGAAWAAAEAARSAWAAEAATRAAEAAAWAAEAAEAAAWAAEAAAEAARSAEAAARAAAGDDVLRLAVACAMEVWTC